MTGLSSSFHFVSFRYIRLHSTAILLAGSPPFFYYCGWILICTTSKPARTKWECLCLVYGLVLVYTRKNRETDRETGAVLPDQTADSYKAVCCVATLCIFDCTNQPKEKVSDREGDMKWTSSSSSSGLWNNWWWWQFQKDCLMKKEGKQVTIFFWWCRPVHWMKSTRKEANFFSI